MRIIEADELKKKFIGNRYGVKAIYYQIDNTPTVKAIPVEWIEKWLETCIPRFDYDRMTYMVDAYEMLEDWEEENETN